MIKDEPIATAALAIDLLLLYITTAHVHTDHILQTVQILIKTPSLPLINDRPSCLNATFEEMLHLGFQGDVNDTIRRHIKVPECASLLAACARSIGIPTLQTVGRLAEGPGFLRRNSV